MYFLLQAIQKLKQEVTQMDIRVGVIQHMLLQAKLKEKVTLNTAAMANAADSDIYGY